MGFTDCEIIIMEIATIGIAVFLNNFVSGLVKCIMKIMFGMVMGLLVLLRIVELTPEFEYNKPRGGFINVSCALQGVRENKK